MEEINEIGYHAEHWGGKGHYGVAILSKQKPIKTVKGFIKDTPEDQNVDSVEIIETVVLPKIINETSGLEIINDVFITHNDSGGESSLYFFNS